MDIAVPLRGSRWLFRHGSAPNVRHFEFFPIVQRTQSAAADSSIVHGVSTRFHSVAGMFGFDVLCFAVLPMQPKVPNTALETIGVGRFIFIHKRFLVAGHRGSPMSQLGMLDSRAARLVARRFFSRALTIAFACSGVSVRRDFLPPTLPIFARYCFTGFMPLTSSHKRSACRCESSRECRLSRRQSRRTDAARLTR